ncbi:MAG: hypothetical protein U0Q18_35215 [Bryobacteraceae bacterium]
MRHLLAMKRTMWLSGALAMVATAADLPVRQVVLYKHGVGYFERSGRLGAGDSAKLEFKAGEMDDVLKSLTLEEKGGGAVTGLRYDSSDPLSRKLAGFPFQIGGREPLSSTLDQFKGAELELKFAGETVHGAIVAARLAKGDEKNPEREQVTLLMGSGEFRNFDLGAASAVRLLDPRIQAQFRDYLSALTAARSRDKRAVYIDSTDSKAREVRASYMIPTPVWKSSYRLIFPDSGQPTLEGWAIVDNTTGEDWTNVVLSLVSGRPISFISRLYEPRYVARQTAELPEDQSVAAVLHSGSVEELGEAAAGNAPGKKKALLRAPATPPPPAMAAPADARMEMFAKLQNAPSTIFAPAAAHELGELFEYRIPVPVTVRANESAMLPFLQQKLDVRKLLIYSDPSAANPLNSAEITNSSGKTLDGGPITIYDTGAYAGEALMETVKTGDKRLISYGVDLGTRITTQWDSNAEIVREMHARRGILTSRIAAVEIRTYTIRNVDQKPKTLIIEHAARPGYTLLERQPSEKTSTAYRFEVKLAPTATEKFPVTEERVYDNSVSVTDLAPDVLLTYVRNKNLSDTGRKQLEAISARKQRLAAATRDMQRLDSQISELVRDQERLRQNIGSLNHVSGQEQQVQAYARQLAGQETQLASLRDRRAELDKQKSALDGEIAAAIESLDF